MNCFYCGSIKHLASHKECLSQIQRVRKRSSILNGVLKQLKNGYKPSEILACLAFASDESFEVGDYESLDETSEIV